jgi:drug/metabolite transporter (DMT)-like permease
LALVTLGQSPSSQQWLGIGLVSIGIIALALDRFGHERLDWRLLAAAAGAGFTVACYSVLDAYGTRLMGDWLAYTAWLVVLDSFSFLALVVGARGGALWSDLAASRVTVLISGVLGLASFTVFLWALSRNPVGAVSALRETSVLFATVIGVLAHGEALNVRRAVGAILIVCGIVTIAL